MSWLTKMRMRGEPSMKGQQFWTPETVGVFDQWGRPALYQSKDFPHVFLGGEDDINRVDDISRIPVCEVIDASILPEPKIWDEETYQAIKPMFKDVVKRIINAITSLTCPIFVHCKAGMNRSVSTLATAISELTGRSVLDVVREMKQQRANVSPHDPYLYLAVDSSSHESEETKEEISQVLALPEPFLKTYGNLRDKLKPQFPV